MKSSITCAARPTEVISDRLLEVTLEVRGEAKTVTFAPTETQNVSNIHAF